MLDVDVLSPLADLRMHTQAEAQIQSTKLHSCLVVTAAGLTLTEANKATQAKSPCRRHFMLRPIELHSLASAHLIQTFPAL